MIDRGSDVVADRLPVARHRVGVVPLDRPRMRKSRDLGRPLAESIPQRSHHVPLGGDEDARVENGAVVACSILNMVHAPRPGTNTATDSPASKCFTMLLTGSFGISGRSSCLPSVLGNDHRPLPFAHGHQLRTRSCRGSFLLDHSFYMAVSPGVPALIRHVVDTERERSRGAVSEPELRDTIDGLQLVPGIDRLQRHTHPGTVVVLRIMTPHRSHTVRVPVLPVREISRHQRRRRSVVQDELVWGRVLELPEIVRIAQFHPRQRPMPVVSDAGLYEWRAQRFDDLMHEYPHDHRECEPDP